MKKSVLALFFFCSLVVFVDSITLEGVIIYSDNTSEGEHLLVLFDTTNGKYLEYFWVRTIFKNTVEALWCGRSKFEGNYLEFKGGLGTSTHINSPEEIFETYLKLTVFDVDEKEGTITVRYDGGETTFPERVSKFITFKCTDKFTGKNFLVPNY
jgi:hypothetical protein